MIHGAGPCVLASLPGCDEVGPIASGRDVAPCGSSHPTCRWTLGGRLQGVSSAVTQDFFRGPSQVSPRESRCRHSRPDKPAGRGPSPPASLRGGVH